MRSDHTSKIGAAMASRYNANTMGLTSARPILPTMLPPPIPIPTTRKTTACTFHTAGLANMPMLRVNSNRRPLRDVVPEVTTRKR